MYMRKLLALGASPQGKSLLQGSLLILHPMASSLRLASSGVTCSVRRLYCDSPLPGCLNRPPKFTSRTRFAGGAVSIASAVHIAAFAGSIGCEPGNDTS